jgi:multidrug efflux system membrane fusion protein
LLLLAAAGGGYYYWHSSGDSGKAAKKHAEIRVTLAEVSRNDVPVYLTGLGTVQAHQTVTVRTQVDGKLMAIRFREGQDVKAGSVLAQIDPRSFQAQYDQAVASKARDEAQLANARVDLSRYLKLGSSVARQVLDTQRATVKQLEATVLGDQAAITNAKTSLSYTTITAPISGRTGIRQVDQGNIVHPGDANGIVVITQLSPISVIFSLPQQQLAAINTKLAHHPLTVDALASDNKTIIDHGTLQLVDNQIDQTTGTIRLKATFPNRNHALWPGAFTTARLLLTTHHQVLTVPTSSIQHGPQGAYVFLYHAKEGTVAVQLVSVSMAMDTDSVIDSGLTDGDVIVTDGMASLQDGSKVSAPEPKKEAAAVAAPTNTAAATTNPDMTTNPLSPAAAAKLTAHKKQPSRQREQ